MQTVINTSLAHKTQQNGDISIVSEHSIRVPPNPHPHPLLERRLGKPVPRMNGYVTHKPVSEAQSSKVVQTAPYRHGSTDKPVVANPLVHRVDRTHASIITMSLNNGEPSSHLHTKTSAEEPRKPVEQRQQKEVSAKTMTPVMLDSHSATRNILSTNEPPGLSHTLHHTSNASYHERTRSASTRNGQSELIRPQSVPQTASVTIRRTGSVGEIHKRQEPRRKTNSASLSSHAKQAVSTAIPITAHKQHVNPHSKPASYPFVKMTDGPKFRQREASKKRDATKYTLDVELDAIPSDLHKSDLNSSKLVRNQLQSAILADFDPVSAMTHLLITKPKDVKQLFDRVTSKSLNASRKQNSYKDLLPVQIRDSGELYSSDDHKLTIQRAKKVVSESWLGSLSEKPQVPDVSAAHLEVDSISLPYPELKDIPFIPGLGSTYPTISSFAINFEDFYRWSLFQEAIDMKEIKIEL